VSHSQGGVGNCPSCRHPLTVDNGSVKLASLPVGVAPTMTTRGVVFVRNQLLCECCHSAYNDWQVQHTEWEKLPAQLRQQNLCRDCYGAALPADRQPLVKAVLAPVVRATRRVPHLPLCLLILLVSVATFWALAPPNADEVLEVVLPQIVRPLQAI